MVMGMEPPVSVGGRAEGAKGDGRRISNKPFRPVSCLEFPLH